MTMPNLAEKLERAAEDAQIAAGTLSVMSDPCSRDGSAAWAGLSIALFALAASHRDRATLDDRVVESKPPLKPAPPYSKPEGGETYVLTTDEQAALVRILRRSARILPEEPLYDPLAVWRHEDGRLSEGPNGQPLYTAAQLEAAVSEVVAKEREACAYLADQVAGGLHDVWHEDPTGDGDKADVNFVLDRLPELIRSRGGEG